ncbi:MAG: hypothetical protein V3W44_02225 [Dehalococcoidales bacterium]
MIEGPGVTVDDGNLQAAVEEADASYYERYNRPATHVSLPVDADTEGLELWPLELAGPYGKGLVIVGHLRGGGDQ